MSDGCHANTSTFTHKKATSVLSYLSSRVALIVIVPSAPAAAAKEVETLDGARREAFTPWLAQAHARLGADQTLARLEGLLLVSMGGDAETARP
jgi:hypothetical protein